MIMVGRECEEEGRNSLHCGGKDDACLCSPVNTDGVNESHWERGSQGCRLNPTAGW